jgi:hypothetical protein
MTSILLTVVSSPRFSVPESHPRYSCNDMEQVACMQVPRDTYMFQSLHGSEQFLVIVVQHVFDV